MTDEQQQQDGGEPPKRKRGRPRDPGANRRILDAARAALGNATGYPASIGYPALREAAATWIRRRFGVELGPDAITACIGVSPFL